MTRRGRSRARSIGRRSDRIRAVGALHLHARRCRAMTAKSPFQPEKSLKGYVEREGAFRDLCHPILTTSTGLRRFFRGREGLGKLFAVERRRLYVQEVRRTSRDIEYRDD